jgi:hypothetical protein
VVVGVIEREVDSRFHDGVRKGNMNSDPYWLGLALYYKSLWSAVAISCARATVE